MPLAGWIFLVLIIATLGLDGYAIRKVFASPFYEPGQRWAQVVLVVLVPLGGAWLVLYLCRENIPLFQNPPVDHVKDIDPTCSDITYDGGDD